MVVACVLSFASRARAQPIPCNAGQGAAYCRAQWEARYPNSAGSDACWGNTDCYQGYCNYYTANRCGTSGNSPDAQCCAGPNVNCQNGNAVSCNDSCYPGFATCRNNPSGGYDYSFGCPYSLSSDVNNCGSCNNACPHINGTAVCGSGTCSTQCYPGWKQCNAAVNACNTHSDVDVNNCGACNHVCPLGASVATAACNSGVCGIGSCSPGAGDCDGVASNGCEHDVTADVNNCGGCNHVCNDALAAHQIHTCSGGTCGVECSPHFKDCDNVAANGCEVQLNGNDIHNCGACNHVCTSSDPTMQPVCNLGVCGLTNCPAGNQTCGGGALCATPTNTDVNNCGGCGAICSSAHITPSCAGGVCNGACTGDFADCNGDKLADGCEVNLGNDVANCGACNHACNVAHAVQVCTGRVCTYTVCNGGYSDCDGDKTNGCETLGACPVAVADMTMASMPVDMSVSMSSVDMSVPTSSADMAPSSSTPASTMSAKGCAVGGSASPTSALAPLFILLLLAASLQRRRRG